MTSYSTLLASKRNETQLGLFGKDYAPATTVGALLCPLSNISAPQWEFINGYHESIVDSECCCCGGSYPSDALDAEELCEDCEDMKQCYNCREWVEQSDCQEAQGEYYCQDCFDRTFAYCERCEETVYIDDIRCVDGSTMVCNCCLENHYSYCRQCDEYFEGSGTRCLGCEPESKRFIGSSEHKRSGSLRKYGIELEASDGADYNEWIDETCFKDIEDGSLPYDGREFVSPPMYGDNGLREIENICSLASHCEVDDRCGLHLHVDLTDHNADDRKALAVAYCETREQWHSKVDEKRHNTSYAMRDEWNVETLKEGRDYPNDYTRYIWANWRAFAKHKTIEIRLMEGTFDAQKIIVWTIAHIMFVDLVKEGVDGVLAFDSAWEFASDQHKRIS